MNKLFPLLLSLVISLQLLAQEESFPCEKAKPGLKTLVTEGKLDKLYVHDCYGPGLHQLTRNFFSLAGERNGRKPHFLIFIG